MIKKGIFKTNLIKTHPTSKQERALSAFYDTLNCAQAVLSTYAEELGLSHELALKIASPFGGGMAHMDEVCGAVSGALMVLGLRFGMATEEDLEAKERCYTIAQKFMEVFREKNGSLRCTDLIGLNLNVPKEYEKAENEGIFETVCTKLVKDSVEIIETLI